MTDEGHDDDAPQITEAEALMQVAAAIRALPREAKRLDGDPLERLGFSGPRLVTREEMRQRQREKLEDKRVARAELRANIAVVIAGLGALGSVLAVVLR